MMPTMRFPLLSCWGLAFCLACGLAGCTDARIEADAIGGQTMEEGAILAAVQGLFQALEARDASRLSLALREDATFTRVDVRGDTLKTKFVSGVDFIASVSGEGPPLIERMQDPIVHWSGDFADVWTAYTFHIGEELSHCGHDAIQLVRENGRWRTLGVVYTIDACP